MFNLVKYLSTLDTVVRMKIGMDHFNTMIVGAVDAAFYPCDWRKHRLSREIIFISCVCPWEEKTAPLRPTRTAS
ncbi:uncharacterized protein B0P05DRAFT_527796 [Gilbertella persicaria]|uniref:uncharacterized protein n=1 Tax=Gilbertella persicaria TaxID=101096 RepID=UPI00221F50FE|nr:uncharacterized protein B0P05DRAFT_527796 [Gilbertella persicaria]KAI8091490.1 hypothetical protein B0P05DRAFT_527796 [Gilbertella persicaria]